MLLLSCGVTSGANLHCAAPRGNYPRRGSVRETTCPNSRLAASHPRRSSVHRNLRAPVHRRRSPGVSHIVQVTTRTLRLLRLKRVRDSVPIRTASVSTTRIRTSDGRLLAPLAVRPDRGATCSDRRPSAPPPPVHALVGRETKRL